jgi:hypothetical protein
MPLKINEFVIQAKVTEEGMVDDQEQQEDFVLPPSVKKEIIDDCLEKMKEYLERNR